MARVRKPRGFDAAVKQPGAVWMKANPKARRPRDLWSPYRPQLRAGFGGLCGYAAMHVPTGGTVDHFLSWKTHPELAYEWSNYRYASGLMNNIKRTKDDRVLDPFEVGDGWFQILLPSLQMVVTDGVPESLRAKAQFTLVKLGLRDDERVLEWRRSWYELYQQGKLTLEGLAEVAPLIAQAVRRQGAGA